MVREGRHPRRLPKFVMKDINDERLLLRTTRYCGFANKNGSPMSLSVHSIALKWPPIVAVAHFAEGLNLCFVNLACIEH